MACRHGIGSLVLALFAGSAQGRVQMPRWFSDNMVLQTNTEYGARSFLNGRAAPNENVRVIGCGGYYMIAADEKGDWVVQLNPRLASRTACDIHVYGEDGSAASAKNVVWGDVFFCSGQSNMVFPLRLAYNVSAEIATLEDPRFKDFRFFMSGMARSSAPLWDLPEKSNCTANVPSNCNRWLTAAEALERGKSSADRFISHFSAVCFMTARDVARMHASRRPMGLIQAAVGATRVESWMSQEAIAATRFAHSVPGQASTLYNAMVAPWNRFAIRAVIWYQGEANANENIVGVDKTAYYSDMLQSMIRDWRDRKGIGDFAFVAMQLPPSVKPGTPMVTQMATGRMEIRLAQAQILPHPSGRTDISGLAVGIDLGGKSARGYNHPPNKNEMSRRLALQTLHSAYALQEPLWTGPVLESVATDTDFNVVLSFAPWSSNGMRLADIRSINPDGSSNKCTLCCQRAAPFEISTDGGRKWTRVSQEDTRVSSTTVVLAHRVPNPDSDAVVRYAWLDFVECALYNSAGLPLAPFTWTLGRRPIAKATNSPSAGMIQSPPMGYNTWNFYHCNIDENVVKAVADAISSNGMKEAGYEYVNIDDCWMVERLPNGSAQPDPVRFPSGMKAVADYVHSKGLKFGVYTAQHSQTCQSRPGAYQHEEIDAATYCEWGVDYLKIDRCRGEGWAHANTSWILFQKGFDKCRRDTGRYIVQSVETCRDPTGCGQWIAGVANLWRTTADVQATWQSVMANIHSQNDMAPIARPGHFNDPDMLQVGNVGLSVTEQIAHMSLWCVAGAPLLAGTDLVHASATTLAILSNPEVIAINQDLGFRGAIQGVLVRRSGSAEVWAKRLADGRSSGVVLLNLGEEEATVTAHWSDIGIVGRATVRDLWAHRDLGLARGSFDATVPSHGAVFVKIAAAGAGAARSGGEGDDVGMWV